MSSPIGRVNGRYATKIAGKPLAPSVTMVSGILDKPGLAPGAVKEAAHFIFEHPEEITHAESAKALSSRLIHHYKGVWADKRDRGTAVHEMAEQWAKGQVVDCPPDCEPYLDALWAFYEAWLPVWIETERTIIHDSPEAPWAGTFDAIVRLCDGRVYLLDFKTGADVYPEVRWQMAAYRHGGPMGVYSELGGLIGTEPMPEVDACAVLHLRGDGTYALIEVEAGLAEFEDFAQLRWAWAAQQRLGKKVGDELRPPIKVV